MNQIVTTSRHWQVEAYNAAENGEPFYIPNVNPDDADFLAGLAMRFPRPKLWSGNSFFFNPPMDPKFVARLNSLSPDPRHEPVAESA